MKTYLLLQNLYCNRIMKYISLAIILIVGYVLCMATVYDDIDPEHFSRSIYESSEYDFGNISADNGPVTHTFECVNSGNSPLIILDVTSSCECTTAQFTTSPIAPGEKGLISVIYDPAGHSGAFNKMVVVKSNGIERFVRLVVKGYVVP